MESGSTSGAQSYPFSCTLQVKIFCKTLLGIGLRPACANYFRLPFNPSLTKHRSLIGFSSFAVHARTCVNIWSENITCWLKLSLCLSPKIRPLWVATVTGSIHLHQSASTLPRTDVLFSKPRSVTLLRDPKKALFHHSTAYCVYVASKF